MTTPDPNLGWQDVERLSERLARGLGPATGLDAFDRIVGVARGGLVPAVLLAAQLGVKRVETVQIRLYDGAHKLDEPAVVGAFPEPAGPSGDPQRTLIVDEILDTGETFSLLKQRLPLAHAASLVVRASSEGLEGPGSLLRCPLAPPAPDDACVWAATAMDTEAWVVFPWSPAEDRAGGNA